MFVEKVEELKKAKKAVVDQTTLDTSKSKSSTSWSSEPQKQTTGIDVSIPTGTAEAGAASPIDMDICSIEDDLPKPRRHPGESILHHLIPPPPQFRRGPHTRYR